MSKVKNEIRENIQYKYNYVMKEILLQPRYLSLKY